MTPALKTGLLLLLCGLFFGGSAAWNFRTGMAPIRLGVAPDRKSNPLGFWLAQIFLLLLSAMSIFSALMVLAGVTPP